MSLLRLKPKEFKDLNSIGLAFLKVGDYIVSRPELEKAYKISRNKNTKESEVIISASVFEKILANIVGDKNKEEKENIKKAKDYIKMFRELGWMVTEKNSIMTKRKVNGNKVRVYAFKEKEYDFIDDLFGYSDMARDYRERMDIQLAYEKVLKIP